MKNTSTGSITLGNRVKGFLSISGMGVLIAFAVLCILLGLATDNFFTANNFMVVIRQSVWVGIMAIGMTYVIATGQIDLSVGSTIGFTGLVCAALIKNYAVNIYLALVISLVVGVLIGLVNGFFVAILQLPSFIATLGTMSILRGLIYVYTQAVPIFGLDYPELQFWAQGFIGVVPVPIIILAILVAVSWYMMYRTKFGRFVLSIGSNEEGAKLVGINVPQVKVLVYVLTGFLCAVSGILLVSRSEAAIVEAGSGYEMDAIAAVIIGGTSMAGGKANLLGTILGTVLMTTIRNGLNLMKISSLWHQVVIGAVILIAVTFDRFTNRNNA